MMKQFILPLACVAALSACSGKKSYTPTAPWKETDKHLSCDQLLLETNDAKFWNRIAHRNKEMGVMDFVFPVSYMNTKASAEEAIGNTQARIDHLKNIYEIKGCSRPYADTPVRPPSM